MDAQIIYTVIAGLLLIVSALGTIIPVLPGSLLTITTLLGWGWLLGSAASWWAAGLGMLIAVLGWSASAVLTGRKLKAHQIPKGSIFWGLIGAIAGAFIIPVVGLFIGFALGLFIGEAARHRKIAGALASSWATLKAMGSGHPRRIRVCPASHLGVGHRFDHPLRHALDPPHFAGIACRLNPVGRGGFADCVGQVVAHGSGTQVHRGGDLRHRGTGGRQAENFPFTLGQRIGARFHAEHGALRVDHFVPAIDPADCGNQLRGRRILNQESVGSRFEGLAEITWPVEGGQESAL